MANRKKWFPKEGKYGNIDPKRVTEKASARPILEEQREKAAQVVTDSVVTSALAGALSRARKSVGNAAADSAAASALIAAAAGSPVRDIGLEGPPQSPQALWGEEEQRSEREAALPPRGIRSL